MAKLCELAKTIRSKNAKAFTLIFDVIFDKADTYKHVKESGIIGKDLISKIYRIPVRDIMITWFDEGLAFKIAIPRPVPQGDAEDGDMLGGQQYAPLLEIEIP